MANPARPGVVLALATTLVAGDVRAQAGTAMRAMTLSVENAANVPNFDLSTAKREVTRVYAAAGVPTVWMNHAALADGSRPMVYVVLMSRDRAARKARLEGVSDAVLGQANKPAARVYIYWHRIADRALQHGFAAGELLGLVLAHEIGHVLLPENSHSAVGIMKAGLGVGKDVGLRFTDAQGRSIRQLLAAPSAYQ